MAVRIASDVGGTFTDSIAYDPASRRIAVSKVPTTPQGRDIGTVEGLRAALGELGTTGRAVAYVGHGMTTATNAVIQRTGARTAFVTNRGFKDLLLIGRQDRPSLYDIGVVRTPPLVPARALLRHRRAPRPRRARDRPPGRNGARRGRRGHAGPRRGGHSRRLPPRLCQPGARARRQGAAGTAPARHRHLHLVGHPARISRVRARQHHGAQRLPHARHGALSRRPDRPAAGRRQGPRHRARHAGHGHGGGRRADDGGDRARQAGAHRAVRPGRRRHRRGACRAGWQAPTTSSPWTSAAPAPTSA